MTYYIWINGKKKEDKSYPNAFVAVIDAEKLMDDEVKSARICDEWDNVFLEMNTSSAYFRAWDFVGE